MCAVGVTHWFRTPFLEAYMEPVLAAFSWLCKVAPLGVEIYTDGLSIKSPGAPSWYGWTSLRRVSSTLSGTFGVAFAFPGWSRILGWGNILLNLIACQLIAGRLT